MVSQLLMEKIEDSLLPADPAAIDAMRQIPERSIVKIQLSIPRNVRHHRLFFAFLNIIFEAQKEPKEFPTQEKLLDAIKIATGHIREVRDLHGKIHIVPDSISFGRMDQMAFRQFFDAAVRVVLDRILPGVQRKDLEQQIYDLLREPGPEQMRG